MTRPEPKVHPLPPQQRCPDCGYLLSSIGPLAINCVNPQCGFVAIHPLPPLQGTADEWVAAVNAAVVEPPVRVIRLAGVPSLASSIHLLGWVAAAASLGADVVELATAEPKPGRHPMPSYVGYLATRAAHFARLALGVE